MPSFNVSSAVWSLLQSADAAAMRTNIGLSITQAASASLIQTGGFAVTLAAAANVTLTLPGSSATLATLAGAENFTNKTITSGTLTTCTIGSAGVTFSGSSSGSTVLKAAATASGTITLPTGTRTLATLDGTETLQNKTMVAPVLGSATCTTLNGITPSASGTSSIHVAGAWALGSGGVGGVTLLSSGSATLTLPSGTNTLYGTGAGTITSLQLKTSLSDETGSGAAVFATSPSLVTPVLGVASCTSLSAAGNIVAAGSLSGNGAALTGSIVIDSSGDLSVAGFIALTNGGSVSQATSKSTGVTLNKITGQITMNAAALGDATNAKFTCANSAVLANSNVIINHVSGGTAGAYQVWVTNIVAGVSFDVSIRNVSGGSLSESPVLQFTIIGGSA